MSNIKVLENPGTFTTSTEGITINRAIKQESGIIRYRLNNLNITHTQSSINIDTGHLFINGVNVILQEQISFTVSPTEFITKRYLVCRIDGNADSITADFQIISQYNPGIFNLTGEDAIIAYNYLLSTITIDSTGIVSMTEPKYLITQNKYLHNILIWAQNENTSVKKNFTIQITTDYSSEVKMDNLGLLSGIIRPQYIEGPSSSEGQRYYLNFYDVGYFEEQIDFFDERGYNEESIDSYQILNINDIVSNL